VAWVQMLLAIAKTASVSTLETEGLMTYSTVAEFLDAHNVDATTKSFLLRREAQLNRVSVAA
jgi:hypothetical protein